MTISCALTPVPIRRIADKTTISIFLIATPPYEISMDYLGSRSTHGKSGNKTFNASVVSGLPSPGGKGKKEKEIMPRGGYSIF
jgi:hypothetical protein